MAATREKVSLGSVYTTGEGNGSLLEEITVLKVEGGFFQTFSLPATVTYFRTLNLYASTEIFGIGVNGTFKLMS